MTRIELNWFHADDAAMRHAAAVKSAQSYLSPVLPVPDIVVATDDARPVKGVDHDADDEQHYEIGQAATRGGSLVVVGIVTAEPRAAATAAATTTVVIVARPLISIKLKLSIKIFKKDAMMA